ncbi:uncharacterized protein BP5553_09768 [Venustampulla echinocandica]|uniref:Uncharacterized protein n=1 Tax=Venustampulla echinocandica TaxID=2656787 RepID=A0A370TB94_9HELO|nr:uncharacterized protein BP5553_09993 [Venustampulla echinocandica]XP_031865690.1 uncharacterized protein BP5553_09768 [Venustampulla echinocandica]RDL31204.1 hypothetical protein BP5553_09993 [Venustampulla echinocandica]RDL31559.1 hypothetical protein BP5553_09768 [Venustampulla echinocandica]
MSNTAAPIPEELLRNSSLSLDDKQYLYQEAETKYPVIPLPDVLLFPDNSFSEPTTSMQDNENIPKIFTNPSLDGLRVSELFYGTRLPWYPKTSKSGVGYCLSALGYLESLDLTIKTLMYNVQYSYSSTYQPHNKLTRSEFLNNVPCIRTTFRCSGVKVCTHHHESLLDPHTEWDIDAWDRKAERMSAVQRLFMEEYHPVDTYKPTLE